MKIFVKLCVFLLSIFGLASCDDPFNMRCEYGTPNADFEIKGKVTDADNRPIKGIQVTTTEARDADTVFTNADGIFELKYNSFPHESQTLEFKDIDGAENGEYIDKKEDIKTTKIKDSKESWYRGVYGAENVVIVMEEKQAENE